MPQTITSADVLYVCVTTKENTINMYPFQKMKAGLTGKIYIHLLTTKGAKEKEWNSRLKDVLAGYAITESEIDEKNRYGQLLSQIIEDIKRLYTLSADARVVINYGGGLKIFTAVLFQIPAAFPRCKFVMVYPDKQDHYMLWDEIIAGKVDSTEQPLPLKIDISSTALLSMYRDVTFESFHTVDTKGHHTLHQGLVDVIKDLPDIYQDDCLKDLMYLLASQKSTEAQKDATEQIAAGNGSSSPFDFLQLLQEAQFKAKVKANVIKAFNAKGNGFELSANFDFSHTGANVNQIPVQIANLFLDPKIYKGTANAAPPPKNFVLSALSTDFINKNPTLSLPPATTDHLDGSKECELTFDVIKQIFKHYDGKVPSHFSKSGYVDIGGHGTSFELYCLKLITEWARVNKDIIQEVTFSFSAHKKATKIIEFEVDIMVYTAEGSVIFFECKTHSFEKKEFLAAYHQIGTTSGVFNKYVIIVPPLPSKASPNYYKARKVLEDIKGNLDKSLNITCCQIGATGDAEMIYGSLDLELAGIIAREKIKK
jgi:hypothetical protein